MTKPLAFGTVLLLTSQLVAPAALAQTTDAPPPAATGAATTPPQDGDKPVDVSAPGYDASAAQDIVVIGKNIPNTIRATPQVVSVLSSQDIQRTGEGDIAGALTRVTGLSVVGNGFVFVRGLGDRYSLAMLNGLPLPSPEPLRRTVPLDIFPTEIVASALVQKSYSVNYPGDFGGGVINLTTKAIPDKPFVQFGGSVGYDTFTTNNLGYVYDGGGHDWNGYDDGTRSVPSFIPQVANGTGANTYVTADQIATMENRKTTILQANDHIPVNLSANLSLGTATDIGDVRLGIIATGSFSNSFRTRDQVQQQTTSPLASLDKDYRSVVTDNRIVANGLLSVGAEFGKNRIRWTNVYIHDTLKQGNLATATEYLNTSGLPIINQKTNWAERQLVQSQLAGEFKFGDLSLDLRGSYANTKRKSPYEREFQYVYNTAAKTFVNYLSDSSFSFARLNFSDLSEDLWSGQADVSYKLPTDRPITISGGFYYSDTSRNSSYYQFEYRTTNGASLPSPYYYLRPDQLLSSTVLQSSCTFPNNGCIHLNTFAVGQGASQYGGKLQIKAGYGQIEAEVADGLRATLGLRYEDAVEQVTTNDAVFAGQRLNLHHWLPAATLTWNFTTDMQFRLAGSKTIARPQFRELAPQFYDDFESQRRYIGNPFLTDSILWNGEARYEWYFARDQHLSIAAFYKHIDKPIETVSYITNDNNVLTGFSYAPSARLYGVETELKKYFPLDSLGGGFFATRRILVVANYTYTQSKINANSDLVPYPASSGFPTFLPANTLYTNGVPLTGQSDHLVNLQLGIEDKASVSQLTVLANYASKRVTARGIQVGGNALPDVYEYPGVQLDVVARQGISFGGKQIELKFEARNLLATKYQEYQDFGQGKLVYFNRYDRGRIFTLGLSAKF